MAANPRPWSAARTVWPCGSRTVDFGVTNTRAFMENLDYRMAGGGIEVVRPSPGLAHPVRAFARMHKAEPYATQFKSLPWRRYAGVSMSSRSRMDSNSGSDSTTGAGAGA